MTNYIHPTKAELANAVRISKTVYEITGAQPYGSAGTAWSLRKGAMVKTLIFSDTTKMHTLWSGRVGLPKMVTPQFLAR